MRKKGNPKYLFQNKIFTMQCEQGKKSLNTRKNTTKNGFITDLKECSSGY